MNILGSRYKITVEGCAFFMSIIALGASLYDGWSNRQYQRITHREYLQIDHSLSTSGFQISYWNAGNGLSIIKSTKLYVDKKEVASWDDVAGIAGTDTKYTFQIPWRNSVIRPSTTQESRFIFQTEDKDRSLSLWKQRMRIDVHICACSVYGECATISLHAVSDLSAAGCDEPSRIQMPPSMG